MAQERTMAQGQCHTFFTAVGRAKKESDSKKCNRCHAVLVEHTEAGIADYTAVIRSQTGTPSGAVIEVKDGEERFNFREIHHSQWRWLRRWEMDTGGTAWFWILLGDGRVNSKIADYPRATFLVTRHVLCLVRRMMIQVGNVDNLPLNKLASQTRIATRENNLYAHRLLYNWRCIWQGHDLWLPNEDHLFWSIYNVKPTYSELVNNPDRFTGD